MLHEAGNTRGALYERPAVGSLRYLQGPEELERLSSPQEKWERAQLLHSVLSNTITEVNVLGFPLLDVRVGEGRLVRVGNPTNLALPVL